MSIHSSEVVGFEPFDTRLQSCDMALLRKPILVPTSATKRPPRACVNSILVARCLEPSTSFRRDQMKHCYKYLFDSSNLLLP